MAESELARRTLETAFGKVPHDIGTPDVVFAGDLQCQWHGVRLRDAL